MTRRQQSMLAALLWLALPWVASAAELLQAPDGDRGLWARDVGEQTCVGERGGEVLSCWSRAVGELTDLRETGRGWVAAGQRRGTDGSDLFLLRQRGGEVESLTPPHPAGPRGWPRLVVDDGLLLGMIWLEGRAQAELELRVAEWHGETWAPATTLPRFGTGSQLAPTVTVLDDGRWLVLWTAFDGRDDETVWSLYDRGRWSAPRIVHEDNAMPDITPAVIATEEGAVAAWSWLDGRDYRLRTAFFDGSSWRLDPVAAGRGALDARLFDVSGTYLLAFETVVPAASVVIELDGRGSPIHRAAVARREAGVAVVDFAGSGVAFRWPSGEPPSEIIVPWGAEP